MGAMFFGFHAMLISASWAAASSAANDMISPSELRQVWSAFNVTETLSKLDHLEANVSAICWDDLQKYLSSIPTERWALQMLDSTSTQPNGLFGGNMVHMGHFDECLSVRAENFKGKHCLIQVKFSLLPAPMFIGVCLPSTCTAADIKTIFQDAMMNGTIDLDKHDCSTDDPKTVDSEDWIVISVLCGAILLTLASTAFDFLHDSYLAGGKLQRHELYSSFSLRRNLKQLLRISNSGENLKCLNGIRVLTMLWVVLGHQYFVAMMSPATNLIKFSGFLKDETKVLLRNATVSVDTFFLLSGLLVSLVFFRDIGKKKYYDVPVAMIHRFIRLTPTYAVLILIQSTSLIKLGQGPIWYQVMNPARQACREHWWPGLLYVQNFVCPTSMCLGQSWYLSSDMQMFWLSPLLLYPMFLWQKLAPVIFMVALLASVTTNFVVAYIEDMGPHLSINHDPMRQMEIDYTQTYMRLTPYIIGIGLGFVICGIKAKKIRVNLSTKWVIFCWLSTAALALASLCSLTSFYDEDYTKLEAASYLSLHRLGWSVSIAWVIFACVNQLGGPVNAILMWNGFEILGKLSYSIFLIHLTFQLYIVSVLQVNSFIRDFEIVLNFYSVLVSSIILSIPLTCLFEMPFGNIDRYFLRDLKIFPYPRPRRSSNDKQRQSEEGVDSKPE